MNRVKPTQTVQDTKVWAAKACSVCGVAAPLRMATGGAALAKGTPGLCPTCYGDLQFGGVVRTSRKTADTLSMLRRQVLEGRQLASIGTA